jgi:uncharacterized membrane protein
MTDTLRPTPRLASDITRSWVSMSAFAGAIVAAIAVAFALRVDFADPEMLTSAMSGVFAMSWALFCTVMAIITVATFVRASGPELRSWLAATAAPAARRRRFWWSFSGGGAIWWALSGSAVALSVLVDLAISGRATHPVFVGAGIATVPASIAIIIVSFTVSHARLDAGHGFEFPGTPIPRFTDYLYLSVMVTVSFGASDVAVTTTRLRRAIAFHSLLAFAFNAVIIALLVSVLLGAVR